MIIDINNQDRATIKTLHPTKKAAAQAYIFSQEQRNTVKRLIKHGFLPHHTSIGRGRKMAKKFSLEKYRGRFGKGFKMETFSPFSPDFNHCTYFTIA